MYGLLRQALLFSCVLSSHRRVVSRLSNCVELLPLFSTQFASALCRQISRHFSSSVGTYLPTPSIIMSNPTNLIDPAVFPGLKEKIEEETKVKDALTQIVQKLEGVDSYARGLLTRVHSTPRKNCMSLLRSPRNFPARLFFWRGATHTPRLQVSWSEIPSLGFSF